MRYGVGLLLGGVCGLTGCFAPSPRPEDRPSSSAASAAVSAPGDEALMQAAEALERGDAATAAARMGEYVAANPAATMPRVHLAELLDRQGRGAEARRHYERVVAEAQPATGAPRRHLVRCHTRLAAIAEAAGDDYAAALNRGVGLLLVAERDAPDEPTLAKALDALQSAADERPDSARAHAYLARTLRALGQPAAAAKATGRARDCLPDATLTPTERGWLRE